MNNAQKLVWEYYNKYGCLYILKWRQMGITTLFVLIRGDKSFWMENETIVITAHERDKLKEIFRKVKFAYDNLPDKIKYWDKYLLKPKAKYDNVNELFFSDKNSSIKVALDSRSGTVSGLHLTEINFMKNYGEMIAGTIPSLTPYGKDHITIESTANGMSWAWADGYNLWNNCVKMWDEAPFYPLFLPWYIDEGYEQEKPENFIIPAEVEAYRKYVVTWYKKLIGEELSKQRVDNKLYWYYKEQVRIQSSIRDWDDSEKKNMKQEYPTYPEEAFLTTWKSAIDQYKIKEIEEIDLHYTVDKRYPDLRFYRKPQQVLISVDTAWGGKKGDYFCIIWRNSDFWLVFHFYMRCDWDFAIEVLKHIHDLWYFGTIAPEVNAESGGYFIKSLKSEILENWEMENFEIYKRSQKDDSSTNRTVKKYWWLTGGWNRNTIIDNYVSLIEWDVVDEFDDREIAEMKFFTDIGWKRQAWEWEHDDAIMSDAINMYLLNFEADLVQYDLHDKLKETLN